MLEFIEQGVHIYTANITNISKFLWGAVLQRGMRNLRQLLDADAWDLLKGFGSSQNRRREDVKEGAQ